MQLLFPSAIFKVLGRRPCRMGVLRCFLSFSPVRPVSQSLYIRLRTRRQSIKRIATCNCLLTSGNQPTRRALSLGPRFIWKSCVNGPLFIHKSFIRGRASRVVDKLPTWSITRKWCTKTRFLAVISRPYIFLEREGTGVLWVVPTSGGALVAISRPNLHPPHSHYTHAPREHYLFCQNEFEGEKRGLGHCEI